MCTDRRRLHSLAERDLLRRVAVSDLAHDPELTIREGQHVLGGPACPHERGEEPADEKTEEDLRERASIHAVRNGAGLPRV